MSLSTWMRDYLYVPLGGNRGSEARTSAHLLITFLVAGLWHGAAWNFVLWGAWHGLALVIHRQWSRVSPFPLARPVAWTLTAATVGYGWMLFRATTPGSLARTHSALLNWTAPSWLGDIALGITPWLLPLMLVEFWPGQQPSPASLSRLPHPARGALAGVMILAIAAYWERDAAPFLYFQF